MKKQQVTLTNFAARARHAVRMVRAPGPVVLGAATLVAVAIFLVPAAVAGAPTVSLTKPLAGAVVQGTVRLDVSASGNTTRVEYLLDGVQTAYDSTCCSWDESWDTTKGAEGSHSLQARARNSAGEWGYSPIVAVTVDNVSDPTTPPPPPPSTGTQPDRLNCTGYPEPRQFVEAQSWWLAVSEHPSHVHLGACIPERENHATSIPLDVRVIHHGQLTGTRPGFVSLVVKGDSYETTVAKNDVTLSCTGTCESWLHFDLPVSTFERSGLQEIRLRYFVTHPDGNQSRPSINWQTYIANGKPKDDVSRRPYLRMKGWYTGAGYCESAYRSDLTPLPDAPVSGVWSPELRLAWDGDSADRPVTRSGIRLDPNFHGTPPDEGTVLNDAPGEFVGARDVNTSTLSSGPHKLHLKADCDHAGDTNSGVGVVTFRVGG